VRGEVRETAAQVMAFLNAVQVGKRRFSEPRKIGRLGRGEVLFGPTRRKKALLRLSTADEKRGYLSCSPHRGHEFKALLH